MNTKEVCEALNVSPKMLRLYEQKGLLKALRSDNNYRTYSPDDLVRIKSIVILRNLGFPLTDIERILSGHESEKGYLNLFYIQLSAVEDRMSELNEIKSALRDKISHILNEGISGDPSALIINSMHTQRAQTQMNALVDLWDFDEMAADYINRFLKNDVQYQAGIQKARDFIQSVKTGVSVLDIGCGTCNLWVGLDARFRSPARSFSACRRGNQDPNDGESDFSTLTVLDKSLPMLMAARENIDFGRMWCEDILEPDVTHQETFDLVISTFTMHHIDRQYQKLAIDNMLNYCASGGTLLIIDKVYASLSACETEKRMLKARDETDKLRIMSAECPILYDQFISYIQYLGCTVHVETIMDGLMLFQISKGAYHEENTATCQ